MAAGDINSRTKASIGSLNIIYGTLEADSTALQFAISDTGSQILFALVTNQDGTDGLQCMTNSSDGTADNAMGSLWVDSSSGAVTVQYVCAITS